MNWGKARKKPIVIEFREVEKKDLWVPPYDPEWQTEKPESRWGECVLTREGALWAFPEEDLIIKGIRDEIYPIGKDIFEQTYDVVAEICEDSDKEASNGH